MSFNIETYERKSVIFVVTLAEKDPKALTQEEFETLMSSPNLTTDEVLEIPNMLAKFRVNNPLLNSFFQKIPNIKRLFQLMAESNDRRQQKLYYSLFSTSNTTIHQILGESIPLADFIFSYIDQRDSPNYTYFIGIATRIFSRAFDLWPENMSDIFRLSSVIFPSLIRHLDNICIFHAIQDHISLQHKGIGYFLWRLFLALNNNDTAKYSVPRSFPFRKLEPFDFRFTSSHIKNSYILFERALKLPDLIDNEFQTHLVSYLKENEITEESLQLLLSLPVDYEIQKWIIQNLNVLSPGFLAKSMLYLKKADDVEHALHAVALALKNPQSTNIQLHSCLEVVEYFKEQCSDEFKEQVKLVWNSVSDLGIDSDLIRPFLIEIGKYSILGESFFSQVISSFEAEERLNCNFNF